jgi:hypothetical protein
MPPAPSWFLAVCIAFMIVPGAGLTLVAHEPPFRPGISAVVCGDSTRDPIFADSPVMLKKEVRSIDERVFCGYYVSWVFKDFSFEGVNAPSRTKNTSKQSTPRYLIQQQSFVCTIYSHCIGIQRRASTPAADIRMIRTTGWTRACICRSTGSSHNRR